METELSQSLEEKTEAQTDASPLAWSADETTLGWSADPHKLGWTQPTQLEK